jgi:hypothetical protein
MTLRSVFAAIFCFVTNASAQSPVALAEPALQSRNVSIEVKEAADAATVDRGTGNARHSKTVVAKRELTITARNMSVSLPGEFEIEWFFVAKTPGGERRFLFDKGSRRIALQPGLTEKFVTESKELTNERSIRTDGNATYTYNRGGKPDGWIVRAKVREEVVCLKASRAQLEQLAKDSAQFQKFVEKIRD